MANLELVALVEGTPQLRAPTAADTGVVTNLSVTTNAAVGGTLAVTGATTLTGGVTGGLAVTGALSATELITASKGVVFPAVAVPSANANTLDDYEEGAWTPSIALATPGDSATTNPAGRYTKIGNLVHVQGRIALTKGTGSGNLVWGAMPFAAVTASNYQCPILLTTDEFGVAGKVYQVNVVSGSAVPVTVSVTQAGGVAATASASDFGAATVVLRISAVYQTA